MGHHTILIDNIEDSMSGHCTRLNISYASVVQVRREFQLSPEEAIEIVLSKKASRVCPGKTLRQLAEEHGMKPSTLSTRLIRWNGDLEKALNTKVRTSKS